MMNPNPVIYNTSRGHVYIDQQGILIQTYEDNIDLTFNDALEDFNLYASLCEKQKRPVLVDIRNIKSVDYKARAYYSGDEATKYLKAAALVIGNPVSRVIGNFYMGINKTVFPFRLFTKTEDAINWLKSFL
jgi:hypothetical protein